MEDPSPTDHKPGYKNLRGGVGDRKLLLKRYYLDTTPTSPVTVVDRYTAVKTLPTEGKTTPLAIMGPKNSIRGCAEGIRGIR